jgi:endonuclease/exonuclease/phosphatase family metal-dependent hydrolase
LSWIVDSVALLRRCNDETMEMYAQIPICKGNTLVAREYGISGTLTYHNAHGWLPTISIPSSNTSLTLATYNVLHDPSFPLQHRFTALRDAILNSLADMICLQEVSDEFLSSLLGDSQIKEHFRWCSRSDKAIMESERNVVLLARESYGFEWVRIELGGKHKAALVACLRTPLGTVVIAGVHLSAGCAAPILQKKKEELSALVDYLHRNHASDEWIVVGDMNWPDSEPFPLEDELTDVWVMAGGATYDPTTNALAAASARESREPQRYDRILIKRGGSLSVALESLEIFGFPLPNAGPPSDHWGLKATIQVHAIHNPITDIITAADTTSVAPLTLLSTTLTDAELRDLCAQHGCFPSAAQDSVLLRAGKTLRAFVSDLSSTPAMGSIVNSSIVKLIVVPVGSFAMGYHNPGSDVDCVVVGNISPQTFWNLMRRKIRTVVGGADAIRLRRFVKDASVQMMELEIYGVKIDVQFCPAGRLIDR